jgi:hypothetical protein
MIRINRRICLLGNSIILGALSIRLRRCSDYEVISLLHKETRELATLNPDVVLFDLESTHSKAVFSLLENCPTLLLIGVSSDKNQVRMWAGRQLLQPSTQDLLSVINKQLKGQQVL